VADAGIGGEPLSWAIAGVLVAALGILVAADNLKVWIILYPLVFLAPRFKLGDWSEAGEKLFGLQLYDPWILLLLCLWVPKIVATKQIDLPRSMKTGLVLLGFIGLWAIRIAPDRGLALKLGGRTFFEPLFLFAVIACARWTRAELRATASVLTCVAAVVAGISIFGYSSVGAVVQAKDVERLQSYWEGVNHLAGFLVGVIPVALGAALSASSAKELILSLGTLTAAGVGLVLTYTRGAWLALAAELSLMILLLRRWIWIVLVSLTFAAGVLVTPPEVLTRIESIVNFEKDRSASNRLVLWPQAASLIVDKPLAGYGFGGFALIYGRGVEIHSKHAHNLLLDFALAIGVPGLFLIIWLACYVLWRALATAVKAHGRSPDTPFLIGLGTGCVGMLAAGMVDGSIPIWPVLAHTFWFILALTYAMTCVVEREFGPGRP
jgi:putative inorganic carbon (HCO3(-)) transporter